MAFLNGKRILNAKVEIVNDDGGYDEGYEKGYNDGVPVGFASGQSIGMTQGIGEGEKRERQRFWENLQIGGRRIYYNYCFSNESWNDTIYHPIYPIQTLNPNAVFQNASITNTQVDVDLSGCVNFTAYTTFAGCTKLKTIPKLIVPASLKYNNAFANCTALVDITFDHKVVDDELVCYCEIGNSISFGDSHNLSEDSVDSIVQHLKNFPQGNGLGNTLTISSKAWGKFKEKYPIIGSDYTSWEDYITGIGWSLVLTKEP